MSQAKEKFESIFPSLVDELIQIVSDTKISDDAVEWFKQNLNHNTLGGKANRGLSVIDSYQLLSGKKELTDEEYKRAAVLGWGIELLQAFFLVSDDIMDSSKTRRGQPCWYLKVCEMGGMLIRDNY